MGNTANYNFPYPDKTSPKTSPADMKALADAIDARLRINASSLGDDWALYVALREARRTSGAAAANYLVSQPFSPIYGGGATAGGMGMSSGRLVLVPQIVPAGQAIDGVQYVIGTPGNYTSSNTNTIGAYTFDGTTWTRVGLGTSTTTFWKGSGNISSPFTAQIAAQANDYLLWAACLYNNNGTEGAAPYVAGMTLMDPGVKSQGILQTYSLGSIAWSATTTIPATLTTATSGYNNGFTNVPWLAFYRNYA